MAVIDNQGGAAALHEIAGDRGDSVVTRRRILNDFAVAVERESATGDDNPPFNAGNELPNRKRVEELVRDKQYGPFGEIFDQLAKLHLRKRCMLPLTQDGAGLDEMHI